MMLVPYQLTKMKHCTILISFLTIVVLDYGILALPLSPDFVPIRLEKDHQEIKDLCHR